jgi:uncharacterized protein involved in outer membrane biogenesis
MRLFDADPGGAINYRSGSFRYLNIRAYIMTIRGWKKIGIILSILTIIVILTILIVPRFIDLNRYNDLIVTKVQNAVGGKVNLGHLSWGVSNGIWLEADGLSITDASAFPGDVRLSRIYTKISIPALFSKTILANELQLVGTEVNLRIESGAGGEAIPVSQDVETKSEDSRPGELPGEESVAKPVDSPEDSTKQAGLQLPVKIEIKQLSVKVERLELNDALTLPGQTQMHVFRDVDFAATHIVAGEEMAFNFVVHDTVTSGWGKLKGQGSFSGLTESYTLENPSLKLKAALTALHADAIKPYLKNTSLKNQIDGSLSLDINYEGDLITNHRAHGAIDLSRMMYTNPSLFEAAVPAGQKTMLTYRMKLNPHDIDIEKLTLMLGRFSMEASADVHNWTTEPVIKNARFSSDVSLPDLIPLVPWKKMGGFAQLVRETFLAGGKLTLANLALPDIKLSRLPEDPQNLLSKVRLTASFEDITVPSLKTLPKIEAISGRLNLENDILTADKLHAVVGPLSLPAVSIHATNISGNPKVGLIAKGPLKVAATSDALIEKLLLKYGLKSLTGSADIDMRADFDQRKPEGWVASGSLMIDGVRAETYPEAVVMENLKGKVNFSRQKTMTITAEDITAQINQAPVRLSGKLIDVGSPKMLVSARAYAKKLELTHLAKLLPALKVMKLGGILDMDLDMHVPYADPRKSRLNGSLTAKNLRFKLAANDLIVEKGNTEIILKGKSATIKSMTVRVNDQKLAVSGKLSNPVKPRAKLLITSPDLNFDRLLPRETVEKPAPKRSKKKRVKDHKKPAPASKAGKAELPAFARKLTAVIQVTADQGRFKGIQFQNLTLDLRYKHGVIKNYNLNFGVDKGTVTTKGSADLRDLDRITFAVEPDVKALQLNAVVPILGFEKSPISGPLALNGRIRGRTGSTKTLLKSLAGKLNAAMGPGELNEIGPIGEMFAKLFSLAKVQNLLFGRLGNDLKTEGVPYHMLTARTSFGKGVMHLKQAKLQSDAITATSRGSIDLVNQKLDINAHLKPLATVDKALDFIPLIGKAAQNITEIRIDIKGSLADPKIHAAPIEKLGHTVEDEAKESGDLLEGVGKELKKIF